MSDQKQESTSANTSTAAKVATQAAGAADTQTYAQQGEALMGKPEREGVGMGRRIEDPSGEQKERDRMYEERMEEEYAKREGGA